jgi:hypothetical protein
VRPDRRLGWLAVLGGSALALAVQLFAPVGVPLYDGVVVTEPYRYLHPTGEQVGQPAAFESDEPVVGGASPAFAAATAEQPPQAQLIAQSGAFVLTPGATSLHISITAIEPPPEAPQAGAIAGNVYRFAVTDQAGTALAVAACDGCLSLQLRGPDGTGDGGLQLYTAGAWTDMQTVPAGVVDQFQANPTALGDIAIVTAGGAAPTASGIDPVVIFGVGALALWLLVFAFIVWQRVRPAPVPGTRGRGARTGHPSKLRPPRRPGSGSMSE